MADPPSGNWNGRRGSGWSEKNEERAERAGFDSYQAWIEAIEEKRGHEICGGWARTAGRPCVQQYRHEHPKGRCTSHAGPEMRGVANPNFKTGHYSEILDGIFGKGYRGEIDSADPLDLSEERALTAGRRAELVHRLAEGGIDFDEIRSTLSDLETAIQEGDVRAFREAFERHRSAMSTMMARESTWQDLREVLDDRRKLAETDRRRLEAEHRAVTMEQFVFVMGQMARVVQEAVEEHVSKQSARRAIFGEVMAFLSKMQGGLGSSENGRGEGE